MDERRGAGEMYIHTGWFSAKREEGKASAEYECCWKKERDREDPHAEEYKEKKEINGDCTGWAARALLVDEDVACQKGKLRRTEESEKRECWMYVV